MGDLTRTAPAENYARESAQQTLTVKQLHAKLGALIVEGHGARKVFRMMTGVGDGLTHALPIAECFASEPYDGTIVWLIGKGE